LRHRGDKRIGFPPIASSPWRNCRRLPLAGASAGGKQMDGHVLRGRAQVEAGGRRDHVKFGAHNGPASTSGANKATKNIRVRCLHVERPQTRVSNTTTSAITTAVAPCFDRRRWGITGRRPRHFGDAADFKEATRVKFLAMERTTSASQKIRRTKRFERPMRLR